MLANSEDTDQTPHYVASDLGLHCLPRSQKWEAKAGTNGFMFTCKLSPYAGNLMDV